jgi:ABC-type phosphate/phosphonate transport system permease subunit
MARPAPALYAGLATLGLLALVVGAALTALVVRAPAGTAADIWGDAYLRRVIAFTFLQAALSALLAVGLALPVARALARRSAFPGRGALLRLFGLPLVIPVIVAVLGIVAVYGQNGLANRALAAAGVDTGPILSSHPVALEPGDNYKAIQDRIDYTQIEAMVETATAYLAGTIEPQPQRIEDGKQYFVMDPYLQAYARKKLAEVLA